MIRNKKLLYQMIMWLYSNNWSGEIEGRTEQQLRVKICKELEKITRYVNYKVNDELACL
jgi:hypothetical protein